ncbi:MAG: DUF4389 domain-containing protein [Bacterioplanes sp.]|nr:DUF4389 domain-containing protein [Bacterioplanes sp.]
MTDFKTSATSDAFWLKTLYVIGFFLVFRIMDVVLLLLTVTQWIFQLLTGAANPALVRFGLGLSLFLAQITRFLSGATEEKPFPFQDWPSSTPESEANATE